MGNSGRALAIALVSALLGCATGAPAKHDSVTAAGADLAAYATFGWQPAAESAGGPEAPISIFEGSIHDAIRAQLVEKGYREVPDRPDFRIGFESAAIMTEKVKNPVSIGVGIGSWGSNVGGGVSTSVPVGQGGVVTTPETRLTLRAVDEKTNREVWVATSTGEIGEGSSAGAVQKAVAAAMQDFPPRRK